jgi:hypothetical protein
LQDRGAVGFVFPNRSQLIVTLSAEIGGRLLAAADLCTSEIAITSMGLVGSPHLIPKKILHLP